MDHPGQSLRLLCLIFSSGKQENKSDPDTYWWKAKHAIIIITHKMLSCSLYNLFFFFFQLEKQFCVSFTKYMWCHRESSQFSPIAHSALNKACEFEDKTYEINPSLIWLCICMKTCNNYYFTTGFSCLWVLFHSLSFFILEVVLISKDCLLYLQKIGIYTPHSTD